jgi:hypothetical protein
LSSPEECWLFLLYTEDSCEYGDEDTKKQVTGLRNYTKGASEFAAFKFTLF